jgi:hypothetical protein
MWIALVGDPNEGYTVCGPFAEAADIDAAPVPETYASPGDGYWSIPLNMPSVEDACDLDVPLPDDAGYDPAGNAVVFGGDISEDWHDQFIGPFKNIDAAHQFCMATERGFGCAIELKPVPAKVAA